MTIEIRHDGPVAILTLRNPPNNHLGLGTISQLADAFDDVDSDPAIRAILLRSEGRVFCAGADLIHANPVADFRIATPEARFVANFVQLGLHPGFGISAVLERVIGRQRAAMMLLTGRRIRGEEAERWGLVDQLVSAEALQATALALAQEIAAAAPLAVASTRRTIRGDLRALVEAATDHELAEQAKLMRTEDFTEGVRAVTERRPGRFVGR